MGQESSPSFPWLHSAVWRKAPAWLLTGVLLVLSGCAQIPTATPIANQHWSGRIALQVDGQEAQSFSASFELQGTPSQGKLELLSPLGTQLARLQWDQNQATLSARGETQVSHSLESLLLQATGTPIPVAALFDWLSGTQTHADGWQANLDALGQGRLIARRDAPPPRTTLRIVLDPPSQCHASPLRRPGSGQAESLSAHHRPQARRLPPAAIGFHADRLVRHLGFFTAHRWTDQPRGSGPPPSHGRPCRAGCAGFATRHRLYPRRTHGGPQSIPSQAGMGGGSSDAATVLLSLNRLWNLHLSVQALQSIAVQLGADVPFFLCGHNAWVEGIGDKIQPLTGAWALPAARFVVVKPEAGLDTREIFSSPDLNRDSDSAIISGFAAEHFDFGRNDLQNVAQALCPEVEKAINWLKTRGLHGRMTGSGSAVFAQMPHAADLDGAPSAWQVRVCENLLRHPLAGWAKMKVSACCLEGSGPV